MRTLHQQDVEAYWYNLPSAGQSVKLVIGEIAAFSSLHLFIRGATTPTAASVTVLLRDGTCVFEQDFSLCSTAQTTDYLVEQADDGTLHLQLKVETLAELPHEIRVRVTDAAGISDHSIPCRYHRLHGRVTDFSGRPFRGFVMVNPDSFGESGIGVWTDENGEYSLTLPARTYNSICVDDESYALQTLEAWAWHIILDDDQRLDFKVGTGEVYGLTAWPSNGGFPVLFIHFRPMALHLLRSPGTADGEISNPEQTTEVINDRSYSVTELAPQLQPEDIKVAVNSVSAEVISVQEVLETGPDGQAMRSYLVQVSRKGLPKAGKQTLYLEYRKQLEPGEQRLAESMGYCQYVLSSAGLPE